MRAARRMRHSSGRMAASFGSQCAARTTSASSIRCVARRSAASRRRMVLAWSCNSWGYLSYAYARAGRREEAEKLMAEAPALYPNRHGQFQYALAFAGFGDKDRTIDQLERWDGVGPVRIGFTLTAPEFAFVRADPRVKALRKKVGLPE